MLYSFYINFHSRNKLKGYTVVFVRYSRVTKPDMRYTNTGYSFYIRSNSLIYKGKMMDEKMTKAIHAAIAGKWPKRKRAPRSDTQADAIRLTRLERSKSAVRRVSSGRKEPDGIPGIPKMKRRGPRYRFPRDDFESLWAALGIAPARCPITGAKMEFLDQGRGDFHTLEQREASPTIDRFVPEKGYVAGNVYWLSFRANRLKNDATPAELLNLAMYAASAAQCQSRVPRSISPE